MFEIDKEKLGAFISQLRKEKGYTQKELAERLFISNKAVSKWETGASMPDTSLLIPLADLLGVTVTELLTCQRMSPNTAIEASKVEDLVKSTITALSFQLTPQYLLRTPYHGGFFRMKSIVQHSPWTFAIGEMSVALFINIKPTALSAVAV